MDYAIRIPGGLSFLAFGDPDAEVKGLEEFPRDEWPNVPIVHIAFQIMVGLGSYLALLSLWIIWAAWRRRDLAADRRLLAAIAAAAPMGFIAIEAGWTVTEVGRQPWIIYGVMRTADAVTLDARSGVPLHRVHGALLLPGSHRGLAAVPPDPPQPTRQRVEPDLRTGATGQCLSSAWRSWSPLCSRSP